MGRKRIIWLLIGAGGLLLLLSIVLAVLLLRGDASPLAWHARARVLSTASELSLAPPDSLTELASDYPQLASILADPQLGSVYKEFVVAYEQGGMDAAVSLAKERGLLTPDGLHLRATLVLDTQTPEGLVAQLEGVGVEVVSAYGDRMNIAVPVALIEAALNADDVDDVFSRLTELEHVVGVRLPEQRDGHRRVAAGEGLSVVGVEAWHAAGFTGAGIRVGVLDLGFANYAPLLGSALPTTVGVASFGWIDDAEVHGTACAEIVHEIAPDAALFLAWYDGSDAALGEAVEWLMSQDVDIITHSAGGVVSPRDGTGWDARLVDETTAQGVLWVNSSGNEADVHYRVFFTDEDGDGYHDFAPGSALLPIYTDGDLRVYLTWDDSWERASQDYELLIMDGKGELIAASEDAQSGELGQWPVEWVALETSEPVVYAAVYVYDADRRVTFDIFAAGPGAGVLGAVPAYSVNSPGDAMTALTVGAVDWNTDVLAPYSSQGPTTDGRLKPEITAPTGVSGATYGRRGFDGTSASAPHVAGVAALVWTAYPEFTREALVDYLLTAAHDLGAPGPDTAYGYGRLALPGPPGAVGAPTSTPDISAGLEQPAGTPAVSAPPAAESFVTPEPSTGNAAGVNASMLLTLLLLGGFGLGGSGLLVIGAFLYVSDTRARRRREPQPAPVPRPQPTAAPRPSVPGSPAVELPATRLWVSSAGGPPLPEPAAAQPQPQAPRLCPACGARARAGARFCGTCGALLPGASSRRSCPHCGAALPADARFCTACGRPT
jgi:subtilisin family serine protease